jgi:IPT/TIG domain
MTEWPGDLLGQSQAPRPLRPDVRDRLEEVLLTGDLSTEPTTAGLEPDLSKRLKTALGDPVADAMEDVDRPRSLRPATDKSLERAFAGRGKRRRAAVLGAAAAVVLIATGLTVALSPTGHSPSNTASPAPATTTTIPHPGANGAGPPAAAGGGTSAAASATAQAPQALGSDRATTPLGPEAVSAPVVTAISPDSGPATGGTTVTITGRGMETAASVRFGSLPAHFQMVSATQLRVVAPAHAAGAVAVVVSTASRTDFAAAGIHFTYR